MHLFATIFDQRTQPLHWVAVMLLIHLLRHRKAPAPIIAHPPGALALLVALGVAALPDVGLRMFESRFPEIPPGADLHAYHGVLVLAGALRGPAP